MIRSNGLVLISIRASGGHLAWSGAFLSNSVEINSGLCYRIQFAKYPVAGGNNDNLYRVVGSNSKEFLVHIRKYGVTLGLENPAWSRPWRSESALA